MGLQFAAARAVSAVSTWGLKHVFHRPAANFPGKVALYVDPRVIADLAPRLQKGSVCVVGTNGKTTVTNLLADALETAGQRVVCNRTGANLDSGVATALLHAREADWGVFECDELWLAKILPHLQADYVLLLNLFRDQLDRVGEIDRIQESIAGALAASPKSTLVFNADDPLCAAIAERVGNPTVAFGVDEDLHLPQNTVADAQMCQRCSTMLEYAYRQYGQLGAYRCPTCGFARPALDCAARDVRLGADGLSFAAHGPRGDAALEAPFSGAYMVYNLLATWAAADLVSVPAEALQRAIDAFDPRNGRLQEFSVAGRRTLLNLAKNPTGFNQNIKIILQDEGPKAVAFFVNDKEGDGRDVSWLWDIDFEELAGQPGLRVFAGGIRKNDVQVRLKYAGLDAALVDDASAMFAQMDALPSDARAYVIANYTALPPVHAELGRLAGEAPDAAGGAPSSPKSPGDPSGSGAAQATDGAAAPIRLASQATEGDRAPVGPSSPARNENVPTAGADPAPLMIAHLFPDLLNLYGDGGNVKVLERRARERGIPVEVLRVNHGEHVDLADVDLVFLGGGPDREQRLASEDLMRMRDDLHAYVEDDGVLLAICGGFQILGREWLLGEEVVRGLGLVDMTTERAPGGSGNRLIGNIALRSPLAERVVVGYENHAGRTRLGAGVEAFGDVASSTGHGNNDSDKRDGVRYKNVVGTYLHGPLLPKNPQVADALLARALERRARRAGVPVPELAPLDDAVENAANEYVRNRLNAG
ncbi:MULTISPECIES: MurT ligase domain-containing protein [Gordonibacter]|uniref:MurT ligase domain-containing protein n=1 Tax=Gordonibacter TaxID=644652 RepID=UPI001D41E0F8|nr:MULTISPECIES: MurT ligase domain-containing protein [Gordonibacter]MDN4468803.1 MurT ligase domain-containing protein [Gordonibacter sp. RACS_AR68]MDN4508506.1 MurT ligase domain-containing protein [Gordonibacter sp. RACS_AR49]HJF64331.1 MurT ligase domain-containing protein [Gordonibacter urolithinfaciens]